MPEQFRVRKSNYKDFMEEKYYVEYKWCGFLVGLESQLWQTLF